MYAPFNDSLWPYSGPDVPHGSLEEIRVELCKDAFHLPYLDYMISPHV